MIFFYIALSIISLGLFSIISNRLIILYEKKITFERFVQIKLIYNDAKTLAYDNLYRSEVYKHLVNKLKINQQELKDFQTKYIKLVVDLCGPSIVNDLELIYGSIDAICLELSLEFNQKIIDEEINTFSDRNMDDEGQKPQNLNLDYLNINT